MFQDVSIIYFAPQSVRARKEIIKMMRYGQFCPVIFGEGAINELGEEAKKLGMTKVVVVTDAIIAGTDGYKTCVNSLKNAGVDFVEFTGCLPDPPSDVVQEASRFAISSNVNGVIGIGGGSTLDTAKGVNLLFNNPEPITQYFGMGPQKPGYPLICIPTTAGTGSEVTPIGVITNTQTGDKGPGIFSFASLAIADPEMTLTAPPYVTATTGMDALSHAAEAMTSNCSNPKSDLLAIEAIKRITAALPKAFDDGTDIQARSDLLFGSNLAGIAFSDARLQLGHSMAAAVGMKFHLAHGLGCALSLQQAMKFAAKVIPERVKMVGEAMGISFTGDESPEQIGCIVSDECGALMKRVKIPSYKELGISRDDLLEAVDFAMNDACFSSIPAPLSRDEVIEYLGASYDDYQ